MQYITATATSLYGLRFASSYIEVGLVQPVAFFTTPLSLSAILLNLKEGCGGVV